MSFLRELRRGWRRPRWRNRLAYPLSLLYAGLMRARAHAYRCGLLRRHRIAVPVVVVGNLTLGGTGKTPLVIELAHACKARGMKPGVIARGYRAERASGAREITRGMSAFAAGDEPLLIYQKCRVPVAIGRSRAQSAQLLVDKHQCDIIISDDGFQHLALRRDLDIVVIDGERRFGNKWCLPAGPLREPPAALARADFVVVNGADADAGAGEIAWEARIEYAVRIGGGDGGDGGGGGDDNDDNGGGGGKHAQPGGATRALGDFAGMRAHAVAGIGNPGRFFRQLRAHGIDVVQHAFPDHHHFAAADLAFAARGDTLLLTEKDAVKCAPIIAAGAARGAYWAVPLIAPPPPELLRAVFARIARPASQ
ncbi:MAG: tetraacyldisaccharide 4'-kinase [Gammaproteobacteria bacterium]